MSTKRERETCTRVQKGLEKEFDAQEKELSFPKSTVGKNRIGIIRHSPNFSSQTVLKSSTKKYIVPGVRDRG